MLDLGLIGKDGSHLVVISNSSKIKVFNRLTMECQILAGHLDTVMAVSTCPKKNLFVTASKVRESVCVCGGMYVCVCVCVFVCVKGRVSDKSFLKPSQFRRSRHAKDSTDFPDSQQKVISCPICSRTENASFCGC